MTPADRSMFNPIFDVGRPLPYGARVIHSEAMADRVEDYSACRAPSRAERRWKRRAIIGRISFKLVPWKYCVRLPNGDLAMHPALAKELDAILAKVKP